MPTGPSNSPSAPVATPYGTRRHRTLVLCFDGTANEYRNNATNVSKLFSLLRKDKAEVQLCYYQVSATFCFFQHTYVFVGRNRNLFRTGCRWAYLSMGCEDSR